MITGCLRSAPLAKLHELSGIAPPAVRREMEFGREKLRTSTPTLQIQGVTRISIEIEAKLYEKCDTSGYSQAEIIWTTKNGKP